MDWMQWMDGKDGWMDWMGDKKDIVRILVRLSFCSVESNASVKRIPALELFSCARG